MALNYTDNGYDATEEFDDRGLIFNNPPEGYTWHGPTGWVPPGTVQPPQAGGNNAVVTTPEVPKPPAKANTDLVPIASLTGGTGATADWPVFTGPTFTPREYTPAAPFSYEAFTAPTLEQARTEPGYAFSLEQGLKAMGNAQARDGLYRSGGAQKGLADYAMRSAEQNYGNVYNRAANTYTLNRGNAFDNFFANERTRGEAFDRNYRGDVDAFDRLYRGSLDSYNSGQRNRELDFAREFDRFLSDRDILKTLYSAGAD